MPTPEGHDGGGVAVDYGMRQRPTRPKALSWLVASTRTVNTVPAVLHKAGCNVPITR